MTLPSDAEREVLKGKIFLAGEQISNLFAEAHPRELEHANEIARTYSLALNEFARERAKIVQALVEKSEIKHPGIFAEVKFDDTVAILERISLSTENSMLGEHQITYDEIKAAQEVVENLRTLANEICLYGSALEN